jgi:transcriptional regulator with XRE-family HTH domain
MVIKSIPQLIKTARNGRSQVEFSLELGVKQSTLSRYEKGEANPKAHVIEHCMRLVHWGDQCAELTVDQLVDKVRTELGRDDQAPLRLALSKLIDGLVAEKDMARNMSQNSN